MSISPERNCWTSRIIETILLSGLSGLLVILALPILLRTHERGEQLARADRVSASLRSAQVMAMQTGTSRMSAESLARLDPVGPELACWKNIGGCGVGGSGGGADIYWVGRKVPGGKTEVETFLSYSSGEDLKTLKLNLRVMYHLPDRFNVGLQVPYLHTTRHDPDYETAMGFAKLLEVDSFGDLSLIVSRSFGITGATSASLKIGFPTAPFNLSQDSWHIPYDAQPGRGELTTALSIEYVKDRDYGPMIFGASYSYNGGENDAGDFKADAVSAYTYLSYKTDTMVHSAGVNLSYALAYDRNLGTEITDQSKFLYGLQYGLEFSFPRFPLYLSLGASFSSDGFEGYTAAVGVMTSF